MDDALFTKTGNWTERILRCRVHGSVFWSYTAPYPLFTDTKQKKKPKENFCKITFFEQWFQEAAVYILQVNIHNASSYVLAEALYYLTMKYNVVI